MHLVASAEAHLSTDFAILQVAQGEIIDQLGVYAISRPGVVAMTCGTKYADLHVRLERWDGRPPVEDPRWEDCDVLPWAAAGSGDPRISGFGGDPVGESLSLDGLQQGLVQVLSRGRHRYDYGNSPLDESGVWQGPPERWLLRLWPDASPPDVLGGPPRRLAGREWLPLRRTGWDAAMHAWVESGWHSALSGLPGFGRIEESLRRAGRAVSADELLPPGGEWDWASPLDTSTADDRHARLRSGRPSSLDVIGAAAGVVLETYADALEALEQLGLLATVSVRGRRRFVPNAAPPTAAWDALETLSTPEHFMRGHALIDYAALSRDVEHLVSWSPGEVLHESVAAVAVRLGVDVEDVAGALRLLATRGFRVDPDPAGIGRHDAETQLTVRR